MSRESRLSRFSHLPVLEPKTGTLPAEQVELWPRLFDVPEDFVLYGGTGLALRIGHRESVDFDFFSAEPFAPTDLLEKLAWLGRVTVNHASANNLVVTTPSAVNLSFRGDMGILCVAEPAISDDNGVVVASIFDLAGTKAKAILDRSEWRDYVDIATLLRNDLVLADIIGYATTIFGPLFEFPAAIFLRSLVYFEEGTAPGIPDDMKRELEVAVAQTSRGQIPVVAAYASSIRP